MYSVHGSGETPYTDMWCVETHSMERRGEKGDMVGASLFRTKQAEKVEENY